MEEIGSDGELRRKKQHYKRFSCSDEVPKFELCMKFSGKKEFKEAIIQYCLNERKVVKYVKDEPTRIRAACDWKHCPWVCLCSKNSRTDNWQIAAKYEKFIMANPSWNFSQIKNTVQEEMFADVSISKLKRAKALCCKERAV